MSKPPSSSHTGTSSATFVATNDLAAITRGRAVPPGEPIDQGIGWVPANLALDSFGAIAEDNVFGSTGDLRLSPVGASAELLDTMSPLRIVLSEITELDGSDWSGCPRTFARTALQRLREETGLSMVAAFEHEFFLEGVASSAPFSLDRVRLAEPFGSELVKALSFNEFAPENWLAEFGDSQFEVTLAPAEALVAADRAILVRELVRDIARRTGFRASFAPMRDITTSGNGAHIHFSLQTADGAAALFDSEAPAQLSDLGRRFAHGVLAHAPAITAVCAPTATSYTRLHPGHWGVGGIFLGERNREALLRICPTTASDLATRAKQFNLEFRAADGTCNPWLAIGMLAHAGLAGIQTLTGGYPIWPAGAKSTEIDCEAMPTSLNEALDALLSDTAVREWMPADLLETFVQVRRSELQTVAGLSTTEAIDRVRSVY